MSSPFLPTIPNHLERTCVYIHTLYAGHTSRRNLQDASIVGGAGPPEGRNPQGKEDTKTTLQEVGDSPADVRLTM